MARSAALNPASMPFFPGALRGGDDERGPFAQPTYHEQDRTSSSSLSSDFRSVKSSPSPPQAAVRHQPSPVQRESPTVRPPDVAKPFQLGEARPATREGSLRNVLGTLPESEDPQAADDDEAFGSGHQTPAASAASFFALRQQQQHDQQAIERFPSAAAYTLGGGGAGGSISGASFTSASPVSSQDSHSRMASSVDFQATNFEAQLKASPLFRETMDRLLLCEYTTREIQRDLGDINRKVNLLVERALGISANGNTHPEFQDPFSTNGNISSMNKPRPSMGNIAPNQAANADDITSISQRLNTLTSSVGQLLALQTQQMQHALPEARNSIISMNPASPMDVAPNQRISPPSIASAASIGHGLPSRPDLRPGARPLNAFMRNQSWSPGNLDPNRRPSEPNLGRPNMGGDKRRASGVLPDTQGDNWAGSSRESGPVISKWEQLALAPELLRSLGKFGVGPPNKIQQRALPFLLKGADIIAQAPPTQERIAAYVIPAIQVAVTNMGARPNRGPIVIMLSTTVDQANQAHRMIRDLGGPIGVRSTLGTGTSTSGPDFAQELRLLQQNMPHILCGTPQKLHALFTAPGGLSGGEVRFLVLDEVDQLIARNLHEFVFNIVKLLPSPRSRPLSSTLPNLASPLPIEPPATTFTSPFEPGNPVIPALPSASSVGRRFSAAASPGPGPLPGAGVGAPGEPGTPTTAQGGPGVIERQTALFSNTVPQDVLNLATAIHLREPVRVLVRRDGGVSGGPEAGQGGARGLRQFYLYLAFTAGGRSDPLAATAGGGLGIIGSGRSASSAETTQAREWKLDALADIFEDVEVAQAIVHVGGMTALDSVVYKLASRGLDAIGLHGDMNSVSRLAALNKFRNPPSVGLRQPATRVLVIYDVQLKGSESPHVPLVINYDLPKAVEEYSHRVSSAIASNYSRAGVVVNFVTATGGDVEMLRSIECFYKIKCPEVPMSLRDIV